MTAVATPIVDAVARAVRVPFYAVRVGDYVFDTSGRPYRVGAVGGRHTVTIRPIGLWPITSEPGDTITIVRAADVDG